MRRVLNSPAFVPPMLPSLALEPPKGDQWIHEIKFDGYRTVLVIEDGAARAFTRDRLDWSDRYRPIVEAAGQLRCRSAVIDGVVVLDEAGRSDFGAVKTAITLRGRDRRWRLLAAFCRRRSKESTAGAYLQRGEDFCHPACGPPQPAMLIGEGPAEWLRGLATLDPNRPPADFGAIWWRDLIRDAERFLPVWGQQAADLAWGTLDLFGVHRLAPAARYSCMGLLLLVRGGRVVAITAGSAVIERQSGARLT